MVAFFSLSIINVSPQSKSIRGVINGSKIFAVKQLMVERSKSIMGVINGSKIFAVKQLMVSTIWV